MEKERKSASKIDRLQKKNPPAESPDPVCSSSTECTTSQCQNTASPGFTFGTDVIVTSRCRCGCRVVVGLGPPYPPSRGKRPGYSELEISGHNINSLMNVQYSSINYEMKHASSKEGIFF